MSWKAHVATILIVASVVLFTNLGGPRLWDRDEPRNAGCAAEMLLRGDWIVPVFNGELRSHKPVLLYWLMMSAYSVLGVGEFSARFWSAALAVGSCLCVYAIGRRIFSASVGLWAAIILATTLMFDVAGRAATPDSVLIFLTTLALTWFVLRAFPAEDEGEQRAIDAKASTGFFPGTALFVIVLYGIMGLATLAKGPIGVILPSSVIGAFLLVRCFKSSYGSPQGIWRITRPFGYFVGVCFRMKVHWAALVVLAVALPWYVWVGLRTDGAWLSGFFMEHNFGRAVQQMEGHGGSPLYFYPVALMVGFAPWSVFFIPTFIDAYRRVRSGDREYNGLLFAACWVAVYVGLFSLASTKLPSYITPCYPAVALLVGAYVDRWSRNESVASWIWPRVAMAIWCAVGIGILIGLPLAAGRYLPGKEWIGAVGLIPIVAAVIALVCIKLERADAAARAFALGAFLFVWVSFSFVSVQVDSTQRFHELLGELNARSDTPELAHYQVLEPSWVFYAASTIEPVYMGDPAAPGKQGKRSGQVWVQHASKEARQYLQQSRDHYVLTTRTHYERIRGELPAGVAVVAETPYFLKDESIVALGQSTATIAERDNGETRQ